MSEPTLHWCLSIKVLVGAVSEQLTKPFRDINNSSSKLGYDFAHSYCVDEIDLIN